MEQELRTAAGLLICASCDYEVEADEISVVDPVVVCRECVTDFECNEAELHDLRNGDI